jgi:hypothetical protein
MDQLCQNLASVDSHVECETYLKTIEVNTSESWPENLLVIVAAFPPGEGSNSIGSHLAKLGLSLCLG